MIVDTMPASAAHLGTLQQRGRERRPAGVVRADRQGGRSRPRRGARPVASRRCRPWRTACPDPRLEPVIEEVQALRDEAKNALPTAGLAAVERALDELRTLVEVVVDTMPALGRPQRRRHRRAGRRRRGRPARPRRARQQGRRPSGADARGRARSARLSGGDAVRLARWLATTATGTRPDRGGARLPGRASRSGWPRIEERAGRRVPESSPPSSTPSPTSTSGSPS